MECVIWGITSRRQDTRACQRMYVCVLRLCCVQVQLSVREFIDKYQPWVADITY